MSWNSGDLVLSVDGAIGQRISQVFTPTDPGGGQSIRVQAEFSNPAKLENPSTKLTLRMEFQDANGQWKEYNASGFIGSPGTTIPPDVYVSSDHYGQKHRVLLDSDTEANVGLLLQTGFDD